MTRFWVIGSPVWDWVYRLDAIPARGGLARGKPAGGRPGGSAANVARGLASAGHDVRLVGTVGNDEPGRELRADLEDWGVETSRLRARRGASFQALVLLDPSGDSTVVTLDDPHEALTLPTGELQRGDIAYVGDFPSGIDESAAAMRSAGVLIAAPFPPLDVDRLPADLLFVSEKAIPGGSAGERDLFARARAVAGDGLRWLIVTHGAAGASAHGPEDDVAAEAPRARPIDSTGAGDALAAGVLHALAAGAEMRDALALGVRWGALATERDGSVPPRWSELSSEAPGSR